jgi:DNA-binding transcriptional LysR family regulator
MESRLSWEDLRLFAIVARAGSLSGAARATGASVATLSRRMKVFETATGRRLFLHGAQGYALTADGRALLERTARMEAAATDIATWRTGDDGPVRVRISAGTWTAQMLAEQVTQFWKPGDPWVPEFVHCNVEMDIARREIDIGIRNRRPEHAWLAGRRTAIVTYAVYAQSEAVTGWIGPTHDAALVRSGRWVLDRHAADIITTSNEPHLSLALAQAGVGRVVLPIFVGERTAGLMRLSEPIAELQSEEWLVAHHDARHDPPIRSALDALAVFLGGSARQGIAHPDAPPEP